jgi:hypothetical protein
MEETKPTEEKPREIKDFRNMKSNSCWLLHELHEDAEGKLIKEVESLLSTAQVSKIRIAGCHGLNEYQFRHGKKIQIQLKDAKVTYSLTRPQLKDK